MQRICWPMRIGHTCRAIFKSIRSAFGWSLMKRGTQLPSRVDSYRALDLYLSAPSAFSSLPLNPVSLLSASFCHERTAWVAV
ncbi:hypothetical protein Bind_3766 (plasmid) [Beijerinckia indica subsp. indica ATCC 9039]|uniref:Uncharacterized protein n=1 Tax=Beijerinckia indica subsp. indica (strain ATCC 9039 / DSM 1715 / NCIMB 8712) TaxID=395963 RepID=B2ILB2_BEII9|nr:hypothetical protein Bind_3766 [Beijerinckia indica subsp. indica ATCC 9039]